MYRLLIPLLWIRDIYRNVRHIRRMRRIEREKRALGMYDVPLLPPGDAMKRALVAPKVEQPPPYSSRDIDNWAIAEVGDWVLPLLNPDFPFRDRGVLPSPFGDRLLKVVHTDEQTVEAQFGAGARVRLRHGQYGVYKPGRDNYSTSYGFIPLEREEAKHA